MQIPKNKLRKIIREEVVYGVKENDILDYLEEEISELYDDYSTERSGGLLLVSDDRDETFEIAVKKALDVKPVVEVRYSDLEDSKYVDRKIFYLHQIDEIKHTLKHRQF